MGSLCVAAAAQPDAPKSSSQPEGRGATTQPEGQGSSETETGVLPLVGGDTDNGFGGGAIGSIASFDGHTVPYAWQLQFAVFAAAKSSPTSPTYEDAFVNLIVPRMWHDRLRLEIRPSFTRETALRFYGYGDAARIPAMSVPQRDFYTRMHPQLQLMTRWFLGEGWSVLAGSQYLYNQLSYSSSSTLAMEMPSVPSHSVVRGETGLVYDTRDNEISPHSGTYDTFEFRASPRLGDAFPYAYQQYDVQLRAYLPVSDDNTLALRAVGDLLVGDVPFYELSRYEDTSAIGGSLGVRGVPAYTFYGKAKVFGNAELRTHLTRFTAWGRKLQLGVATFVDAGRLWYDPTHPRPDLDGTGLGIHWGAGAGLRLQQGRAFLIRADVAYSPDARPIGGYLLADEIF
ncbi:MAG: BamA/TamA family outer membrane protein [Deltaproteobacteria bacterium]|nr:BamA/TamA family outer membrane protein [Deltaproteobacteria bacterium]